MVNGQRIIGRRSTEENALPTALMDGTILDTGARQCHIFRLIGEDM